MKNYGYTYIEITSSKKPYNTHLWWVVSEFVWYMIDFDNQKVLLKSINKGESWETITTRDKNIVSAWFDRTNSKIYFMDWTDADDITIWYLDLSNDSVNVVGSDIGDNNSQAVDVFIRDSNLEVILRDSFNGQIEVYRWEDPNWVYKDFEVVGGVTRYWFGVIVGTSIYLCFKNGADLVTIGMWNGSNLNMSLDSISGYGRPNNENLLGISYDDSNLLFLIIKKVSDSKNYLYSYSISENTLTEYSEYNIALMLNRNGFGINPNDQENGFEIDGTNIYKTSQSKKGVFLIQDISLSVDFTAGSTIVAITDNYLFVDNSGTIEIWEYTDISKTILNYYRVERMMMTYSKAEINGNIAWQKNQVLELWDNSENLLFRGKSFEEVGQGYERKYHFYGLEREDLNAKVTLDYTGVATGIHTIAKAAIDQVNNYLYYDATSIPDPSITYSPKYDSYSLDEILTELADKIDGGWSVDPDGKVWLLKLTSFTDSTIVCDETTGDISSPKYNKVSTTYNYIHLFGQGYIESDGDSKNQADIDTNGLSELVRYYAGCNDLTELQEIAASLLTKDGIATEPIQIEFIRKATGFQRVMEFLNFAFTLIDVAFFQIATDYIIQGVYYYEGDVVGLLLTNTLFQGGNEIES